MPSYPTILFFGGGLILGDIEIELIFLHVVLFCKKCHYYCFMRGWFPIICCWFCFRIRYYVKNRLNMIIPYGKSKYTSHFNILRHMLQLDHNPLTISSSFSFELTLKLYGKMYFIVIHYWYNQDTRPNQYISSLFLLEIDDKVGRFSLLEFCIGVSLSAQEWRKFLRPFLML